MEDEQILNLYFSRSEQAIGETASRVDIYALGLVLYKLMNHNRLPFLNLEKQLITYRDKENALTRRMSGETPPAPVDAGEAFGSVILKACAYDAKERYQTPDKFREALEEIRYGTANRERGVHEKPKPVEERPVPESMPKFLQEGAARQLARTSQLNTEAIRQARRNPAPVSVQPEKPTAGEIAKNAARNTPKAQSTIQTPQKSASGKTASERDSLSAYQSGFSRQPEPGIRKTGAVKPRVTSITDLEDDRDQNLQEWEDNCPEHFLWLSHGHVSFPLPVRSFYLHRLQCRNFLCSEHQNHRNLYTKVPRYPKVSVSFVPQ